jgi:hypothetical protein
MRHKWSVLFLVAIGFAVAVQAQRPASGPHYRVDPFWPKPLPNKWSMQQIVDIYVDRDDHIWAINRRVDARPDELTAATNPPRGECCVPGPEILEFDPDGNVVNAWGGPNYHEGWPGRLQTIAVDRQKNVYLSGTTPGDGIIEFTRDGKFVRDFGRRGPKIPADQVKQNNQQTDIFPPGIGSFEVDEDAREISGSCIRPRSRAGRTAAASGARRRRHAARSITLRSRAIRSSATCSSPTARTTWCGPTTAATARSPDHSAATAAMRVNCTGLMRLLSIRRGTSTRARLKTESAFRSLYR